MLASFGSVTSVATLHFIEHLLHTGRQWLVTGELIMMHHSVPVTFWLMHGKFVGVCCTYKHFLFKNLEIWNRFNSCQHKSLSHCMSTYTDSAADQQTHRSSYPMSWIQYFVFPQNWGKIAPERRKPHMCFWLRTDNMMRCASSSLRMALGQRAVRSFFFNVQLVTTENHKNV